MEHVISHPVAAVTAPRPARILVVAGDPSGDLHAGNMVRRLKGLLPGADIVAIGGKELQAAGAKLLTNLVDDAVVGFTEVLTHLPRILQVYSTALSTARRADLVVLVDYPGFNVRLARTLQHFAPKPRLLYYIAPQVWAWHSSRARLMERIIDKIAVVFPFEKSLYSNAEYVGHPLFDVTRPDPDPDLAGSRVVALLPGSRRKEIAKHIGLMADCARILKAKGFRPIISMSQPAHLDLFAGLDCELYSGDARRLLASAERAVVKLGTSTLQAALLGVPFVGIYRVSWLSFALGKFLVKIKHAAMPNILLDDRVVPEFIQADAKPERVVESLLAMDADRTRVEFRRLQDILGRRGSSQRVAEMCVELLNESSAKS